jgi:transposase-like protein
MFTTQCASCGVSEVVGDIGNDFETRGKYNGHPAYKCNSCGAGLFVSNAGRALITKRAKTKTIPAESWKRMSEAWDQMFPQTNG